MKWAKYVFAITLLLLALPVWRLLDWANVIFPFPIIYKSLLFTCFSLFLLLPLKILINWPTWKWSFMVFALFISLLNFQNTLSTQAVLEPTKNHCGPITYAGLFYPVRNWLSLSYQDDLEQRNQLCWITKMIKKVPAHIPQDELELHLKLLKNKLMKPTFKYRASLPWITFLVGSYFSATPDSNSPLDRIQNANLFAQNFNIWAELYSDEISAREYAWYEWPHSQIIKAEYALIERNWEKIHIQFNK